MNVGIPLRYELARELELGKVKSLTLLNVLVNGYSIVSIPLYKSSSGGGSCPLSLLTFVRFCIK